MLQAISLYLVNLSGALHDQRDTERIEVWWREMQKVPTHPFP